MSGQYKVWFNGEMRPFEECRVSVRTHALHYGSSVFEGVRAYETPSGPQAFRLTDHLKRFLWSASVYRMPIPWELEALHKACRQAVRDNGLAGAYIRPIAFRGDSGLGLLPKDMERVEVAIIVEQWGTFLGEGVLEEGIDACVTSWQRVAPNTIPAGVKAGGNYLSGFLVVAEARDRGCIEGIALGADGLVSEGAGDNVFVVQGGRILTPPVAASILSGITRDTAIQLARSRGYEVVEQALAREQLYAAEEMFLTGTAVEITPVRKLDHLVIGDGVPGPVTRDLQQGFFGLFDGTTKDQWGWLEPV